MSDRGHWLFADGEEQAALPVDGLVRVQGFRDAPLSPEQYLIMERAEHFGANAVFFEAPRYGAPPAPQAFIFQSDGPANDPKFGALHRRLWSWGGVPLVYRCLPGLVQLFRCAHRPDFEGPDGTTICKPFKHLRLAAAIDAETKKAAWWDVARLRNGTLWDDPAASKGLLSDKAAHKALLDEIEALHENLNEEEF